MVRFVSVAALLAVPAVASAAVTGFSSRPAFDAAAGGPQGIETFESTPTGPASSPTVFPSGLGMIVSSGSKTITVEAGDPTGNGFANTTPAGANYLGFTNGTGTYSVAFGLITPITAFGFDLSGFEPGTFSSGGITIRTYDAALTLLTTTFIASSTAFTAQFFGIVSDTPFAGAEVVITSGLQGIADHVAFDDVTWVVPAPSAAALVGLGGLMAARRRRA